MTIPYGTDALSNVLRNLFGVLNKATRENALTVEIPRAELALALDLAKHSTEHYAVCNAYGDIIARYPYTFPGLNDALDYIIARFKSGKHRGDYIMNPDKLDVDDAKGLTREEIEYIEMFANVSGM